MKALVILTFSLLVSPCLSLANVTDKCMNSPHGELASTFVKTFLDQGASEFRTGLQYPTATDRIVNEEEGIDKTVERWVVEVAYQQSQPDSMLGLKYILVSYKTPGCELDSVGLMD